MIETPIADDEIEPIKNVKNLYNACMDQKTIDNLDDKPISSIIENWPGQCLLEMSGIMREHGTGHKQLLTEVRQVTQQVTFLRFSS